MQSTDAFLSDPDLLAEGFLHAEFIWDPGGSISEGDYSLRWWHDQFYIWRGGRYTAVADSEMKRLIKRHLSELNAQSMRSDGSRIRITTQLINNILLCLSGFEGVHLPQVRRLNTWDGTAEGSRPLTVNFRNGPAMLIGPQRQAKLFEPMPAYFTLCVLPYDYVPEANCPQWLEFLEDVMEGDAERIALLQQWAGYLLSADNRHQKFLLIAGEGQNGKTVFTTTLERMVGEDNVTHVPLCQFGNRFALASTLGKTLNSTTESAHRLDELAETMLKSYTSGDRMTFERKYKEPIHARPTAKMMISTNQLPQFADKSMGLWRRMLFVPFENSYAPELQNLNLANELTVELSGIFNWALEGLRQLRKAGSFNRPTLCRAAVEQYRRDVNPARAFLLENFAESLEFEAVPCKQVYDAYVAWCLENGHRPLNSSNFGKEVKRTFPNSAKDRRTEISHRASVYCGLTAQQASEVRTAAVLK